MHSLLRTVVATLAVVVISGCSFTQTARPVMLKASESEVGEIGVIANPDVTEEFLSTLRMALSNKGFSVMVLPVGTPVGALPLIATYEAEWGWDTVAYLSYASILVYRNGETVGDALYEAPMMGVSMTSDIDRSTQSKVFTMVDQLFPAPVRR